MRKALRISLYVLGGILTLLLIVVVWLNTGPGKRFVRDKVVAFLENKLKTEVKIGELGYGLPKYIVLRDVLFRDQSKDTLLSVRHLRVNVNMLKLLSSKLDVQQLTLEGVNAHVYRLAPDTNYNFTYIINAFAGKDPKPAKEETTKDTSGGGFTIDVNKVLLRDIRARFNDQTGGTDLALNLQELQLKMKKLDLDAMSFHVKELYVKGLQTSFMQDSSYLPKEPDTSTAPTPLQLVADDIDLQHIDFVYSDNMDKFLLDIKLGALKGKARSFDLAAQKGDVEKLLLQGTTVKVVMGKQSQLPEKVEVVVDTLPQSNWRILAGDLQLNSVNFIMDDENKPRQQYGMDYAHLDIRNLSLNANKILYSADSILGNINHLSVQEKSGLDLQELKTNFAYHVHGGYLRNLYLKTPSTTLQDGLEVYYTSLDSLQTQMGNMLLKVNLKQSVVGLKDVLIFAPDLRKQSLFKKYSNGQLKLEAILSGALNQLDINNFYLQGLSNTLVHVKGKLNGLPESNKINYNLNILRLQSSAKDVSAFVPKEALQQVRVPNTFYTTGLVSGTLQDYKTDMIVVSSDGAATLKGYVYMSPGKGKEKYDLYVNTRNLNVGKILRQDSVMGAITAVITARGQSFDINSMNTVLSGKIQQAMLMGYNYSAISFDGKMAQKAGELSLTSNDPNAILQLQATADLTQKDPAVNAILNIDSADLQALKLYKDELRVRAVITANMPKLNADYPEGDIIINNPTIAMGGQRYFLDSLYISSKPTADSGQNIIVNADAVYALITGQTPLSQIGNVIQDHIGRHYKISSDTTKVSPPADYNLNIVATVQDRPLLHVFMPTLESMDTIRINAGVTPRNLFLDVNAPQVSLAGMRIDSAKANVNGTDSALTYNVTVAKVDHPQIQLWYTNVNGNLNGNMITANVSIADSAKKERFALNANLQQEANEQVLQLGNGLVLNYKTWQVSRPNKIVFGPQGFYAQNLSISNGNEAISVTSEQPQFSAPLNVNIRNFFLSNITEIVQKDTLLANGMLNTQLQVRNISTAPEASGTLQIEDLSVFADTIGNLDVTLKDASANEIIAQANIKGNGNDISLAGTYFPKPVNGNNFDMKLDINTLNLKSIEGVTMNNVRNSSGNLKGNLVIKGATSSPKITGDIRTENLTTTISMLGAAFRMPDEHIQFSNNGIVFDDFEIYDSLNNKGTISGKITTQDYKDITLGLKVRAKNWQVLNSTPQDNKLFYGKLVMSSNLNIKGTPAAPAVDGNLTIHDTTKFTVVIPETQPGIEEREGVVEFIDMDDTNRYKVLMPKDTIPKMAFKSAAALNVNIGIEKNAEFNVIIDQATGDFLRVRGEASLNTTINPDGTIGIAGTYELKKGSYQLNYNFIKRRFDIQDGSTIVFSGDPMDAEVNITAAYNANIPPYDLVEKQVSDPAQLNFYKQRLPFDVLLKMKGPLLKPELSFDIVLPEEKKYRASADVVTLVQGKLAELRNNPSELNKQVFAVLVLNRFVSDNPFESGAGGQSAEFIARQSASRFLSEQLNQFASQLISGLELNLDLESSEDYTTGEKRNRTDLNVSASKRLLNDRLTVTVGNNFELEGQNQNTNQNTSLVPGNLAADYQLTPDGRYMVRIYRRDELENIIEGYVVETGVSFIVTVEYNRFRSLFRKRNRQIESKQDNKKGVSN